MKLTPFDKQQHTYRSDLFVELVKETVSFFHHTPVQPLPPSEIFLGTGVYALYYTGHNPLYEQYAALNQTSYRYPIYVGKAVPKGWRQSRISDHALSRSCELHNRLKEHSKNISIGADLSLEDMMCRFIILENEVSDLIGTLEAALIKLTQPLWNVAIDGFGNHDPGRGRYEQAKSDWDVIHPGRPWAERCNGTPKSKSVLVSTIERYFTTSFAASLTTSLSPIGERS